MSSVDKLKFILKGKAYKTYKEFHEEYPKDAELEEESLTHTGKIPRPKVISDAAVARIARLTGQKPEHTSSDRYSEDFADKHKSIDNDDYYHHVMNESTKERKGSTYDKESKTWVNPIGMPSRQHCGATSDVMARLGHGKKVSGKYHGTWNGKPEDHSWVENEHGHIIDASRDQFYGDNEKGIKTIKQDHPDYSKYKKNTCHNCGTDKPPTSYTNMISACTGDNCNHIKDHAPELFKKTYGRDHKNLRELNQYRKLATGHANKLHGHTKAINKLKALLKNQDINRHIDEVMNRSAKIRGDKYNPETKEYTERDGEATDMHCGGTSTALCRMFGKKSKLTTAHGLYDGKSHAWNRNSKGHIIDASRKQFGDREGIHIIKPTDKRYHKYIDHSNNFWTMPEKLRIQNNKRSDRRAKRNNNEYYKHHDDEIKDKKIQDGINALKALIRKDSMDGKGANDKIKPTNWIPHSKDEKKEQWTKMKPEDFLDLAENHPHGDAHSVKPAKYKNIKDSKGNLIQLKPRTDKQPHWGQNKEPYNKEDEERGRKNDYNYGRRGDELGRVETYQNSIRHGKPITPPSLGVSRDGKHKRVTSHEGRHRAEAARREGEKTIPVGIGSSALRVGSEKKINNRQIDNLHGQKGSSRNIRERVTEGMKKLKAMSKELNKKRKKHRMTYPKIGDNVWDSKQNKWVIEDKQGESTNTLEYKKAIDKLKALLRKEGETNAGEKSQKTEDQKKESQEGKTSDTYDNREYEKKETPMYPVIIREFPPDKDDKDPYN